jgi:[acyl-carrier-protein] S-malonyltransferase
MAPAAERLAAELERTPIRPARLPVIANVSARPVRQPDEIRRALIAQVASPVLWEQSVRAIFDSGIRRFVEIGPGTALCGMVRRTVEAETHHVEDGPSREATMAALGGAVAG